MVTTTRKPVTAEALWAMPDRPRYELVDGELIPKEMSGPTHSLVQGLIVTLLNLYIRSTGSGSAYTELSCLLARDPDILYLPDVAFLKDPPGQLSDSPFEGAPDLIVEILSPSNTQSEMRHKVSDYLEAGATLIWLVDPGRRIVTAYERGKDTVDYSEDAYISGADVLPGFLHRVSQFFERGSGQQ
jgi:Uma2 family endonuclease